MSRLQCNVRTCLTDVDGTLFPFGSNRRLSDNNRVALQRAIEAGVHVGLATGRIPGAWSQSIRETLPSLGASVFCNGALVLGSDSCVIAESTLPLDAICRVRDYTRGGRAGGHGRIAVLAATRRCGEDVIYLELAPEGPTFCTEMIRNAGEPAAVVPELMLDDRCVFKHALFETLPAFPILSETLRTDLRDMHDSPHAHTHACALASTLRTSVPDVASNQICDLHEAGRPCGVGANGPSRRRVAHEACRRELLRSRW